MNETLKIFGLGLYRNQ